MVSIEDIEPIQIGPYKFDLYIPNKKLIVAAYPIEEISFNHNETTEERRRLQIKAKLCIEQNLHLIQIFSNEWLHNPKVIKSILNSKFGLTERIYARKCEITELDPETYKTFTDENHLQGYRAASVRLGLIYNSTPIATMSFNKHPKYEWEITRYASSQNITVSGGAGRLYEHFKKQHKPTQLLTYADMRYSHTGNVYRQLGFHPANDKKTLPPDSLKGHTGTNYQYFRDGKIYSRQTFQYHKLSKRLETFDDTITEAANLYNNGYRRLWDSGHWRFLMTQC